MRAIVVAFVLFASSLAHALTTTPPSPIDIGTTGVGTSINRIIQIDGQNPAQTLDHFDYSGASCPRFTVTPAMTLPRTLGNGMTLNVTVTFTPQARGLASCTVTMRDGANANLGSFQITGTGLGPEIAIAPSNGPPLDFGDVRVLDIATAPTSDRTVLVQNIGDGGFSLQLTSIGGVSGSNFSVVTPLPITIPAGGSATVALRFNPSVAGVRTATATFNSNSPSSAPTLSLVGDGTNARIGVTSSSVFDGVATMATGTIAVANTGAAPRGPLRVTTGTIAGGDGWFTFDDNGLGCSGSTCAFNTDVVSTPLSVGVRCTPLPGAVGARTATFTFSSDSDTGGDNTVQLTCTGRADHAIDTTMIAFGPQLVNTTSAPRTVTVTNIGSNIDLVVTSITKGAGGATFIVGGPCGTTCAIPAGESRTFTVAFAPTAPNTDVASTLTVNVTDPDGNPTIALSGRGVAPVLEAPPSVAFGDVDVGKMGQQTVTIRNGGEAPLTISNAILSASATQYTVLSGTTGPQMTVVNPGLTTSWTVSCNPTTHGAIAGTFQITSNTVSSPTTPIQLACTGLQGKLGGASVIDFGSVPEMATPVDRSITISNVGNAPIQMLAATLQPTTSYFSIVGAPPPSLAPGASAMVTVRYRPLTGIDDGPVSLVFTGTWGTSASPIPAFSVQVRGDAILNGFDLAPSTLALGDVRFDKSITGTFCLVVSGQSEFDVTMVQITPTAGTMSGEFTISQIRRNSTCGGGNVVTLPQHVGPMVANSVLEFTVTANPAERIGPMAATVTVLSNLPGPLSRSVMVSANATTGMLALDPGSTIAFDGVDVQATAPTTRRLTITNTGQAAIDLTGFTRTDLMGTPSTLTFAVPPNTNLAPAQSIAIDFTYRPTIVEPTEVHLGHQIAGVFGAPAIGTIVIKGRGIDRTIDVAPSVTAPPTFKNPGSAAPTVPITVRNTGEAPLAITATMLTGDLDVWQLVDPSPVTIAGTSQHDFLVRFAPKTAGPAPSATLEIMHDDDAATPIARVAIDGAGVARDVMLTTMAVDLGVVAVGGVATLEDGLVVQNLDATNAFRIRAIESNDPRFAIVDGTDRELPAAGSQPLAVTFSPDALGTFEATATLFLDEDPDPHATVALRGRAVDVDVHGGGGCSTTSPGSAGGLAIALAALLRRRRRAVLAATLIALPAHADDIEIGAFEPTPSTTGTGFAIAPAQVGPDGAWVASATVSYATNQIVIDATDAGSTTPLARRASLELGGAYAFFDRFEAGARLPIYAQRGDEMTGPERVDIPSASGTAIGDLGVFGRMQLGHGTIAPGVALHVTLPTATSGQFAGTKGPSAKLLGLASLYVTPRLAVSLNAGGVLRQRATYRDEVTIEVGSGLVYGVGGSLRVSDRLWATAELFGEVVDGGASTIAPIEALAGLELRTGAFAAGLAAGRGVIDQLGAPDLRVVAVATFAPGRAAPAPLPRTEESRPLAKAPEPDGDADAVADASDRCAREPEDRDGFEDADGCPDLDDDSDGFADAVDKCPRQAEVINGAADDDGCPDESDGNAISVKPGQSPTQAAEETFVQGRELMKQNKFAQACAAFEISQRLDPQHGTQFNLAGCYVELGKLATAWNLYRELSRNDKNADRRAKSSDAAKLLEPRVPKLLLSLKAPPPGVQIFMNDGNANALVGIATPVDFGSYTIVAGAPGHAAFRKTVDVKVEGNVVTVEIELVPAKSGRP